MVHFEVVYRKGEGVLNKYQNYFKAFFLLLQHLIGLLILFNELAPELIVFPLQLLLPLFSDSGSFLQVLDFPVLEGDRLFHSNLFAL